jgi:hypothetical protein
MPDRNAPAADRDEAFAGYLDELEQLCNAATPGPWTLDEHQRFVVDPDGGCVFELEYALSRGAVVSTVPSNASLACAHLAIAARHALPKLIAKVRRLADSAALAEQRAQALMRMTAPVCSNCNAKRTGTQCADCHGELWEDEDGVRHAG